MSLGATLFAYIIAGVFFILTLRGLSSPETARKGNMYGMVGMAIAILTTLTSPVVQEYCDKYNVVTSTKEGIQLLKYGKDQFFTAHVDDSQKRPRRVSYSYYVNEDYEGGEIVFSNLGVTVKPKAHQLLVFPSSYPYRHEVRPVTSGTRYAIVQWWN